SELESSRKKYFPQNTEKATKWAIKAFTEWAEIRKESGREAPSSDIMLTGSAKAVCDALCRFVSEIQQQPDGEFKPLHTCLENLYVKLHDQGVGTTKVQANVVIAEEEQQLWESGVFSNQTPEGLLNAVFYYNGVNFVLRGGEEHRSLKLFQFDFGSIPDPEFPGKSLEYVDYS
ncbi:PREDICTED: uncharacterized protein LOC105316291, partial [Amphimedon queenslandica]|uniref:ZMYM2-like/QRICH1 C-terminal domain-containing protein n=1 Tax=Amphimedon queenslandica TaxID=400682 RepID=A0AAN0ITA3_AMPQE